MLRGNARMSAVPCCKSKLQYWKQTLAGLPEVHQLPTDRPRPSQQDYRGAFVRFDLGTELTGKLRELSRAHGTTLFTTLLAAWAVLLGRLSGDDDVAIGTPVANRGRAEIEGLIGFFVNTLVLRLDLSGAPSVGSFLDRVKEQALAAQDRQDVPFEQVVEALAPPRSLAHAPLFQVLLSWNNERSEFALADLQVAPVGSPVTTAKFDLTLNLGEVGDRIAGQIGYASALFDRATVERYAGYLRTLLEAMVADEAQCIDRLALLAEEERRRLIVDWNATEVAYPSDRCIHELFEARVAAAPDAVAATYEGAQLTYGELNEKANRLARHLRSLGVVPETRVAICVERSLEMVVGLLAVLKAGGAYVPLDPSYPVDRLRYMLEDSAPAVVLTHAAASGPLGEVLGDSRVPVLDLQRDVSRWNGEIATNAGRSGLTAANLAYVIYTSGSTGQPKGVMVEHRSVCNFIHWSEQTFGLGPNDTVLHKAPLSFDASVGDIFWALLTGGKLVVAHPDGHRDPAYLAKVIAEQHVTLVKLLPPVWKALLEHEDFVRCSSLRNVVSGGEAFPAPLARKLQERLPDAQVYNLYGPTEATVDATAWPFPQQALPENIPIGRPVANTRTYILDGYGEPVPVGVTGELHIGGVQTARGYLNRPELTAERFIASPFVAGDRLYKTGDLARYLPDGSIEYLGRSDFQVKVRGFRIELGEIESRLRQHALIRDVVVLAREDVPGEKRLVAYYTSRSPEVIGAESLRSHVLSVLPEYMVPAAYVCLEALPLMPNGKVDRRAFPAPASDAYAMREYEAPRDETEEVIARIWSEVLEVEHIGRNDNFFELGGHSFLALRVLSLMRSAGIHADVVALFTAPVLSNFAVACAEMARPAKPVAASVRWRNRKRPMRRFRSCTCQMRIKSVSLRRLPGERPMFKISTRSPRCRRVFSFITC